MKKVEILRKKYPKFIYEGFDWKIEKKDLKISFDFRIESAENRSPDIYFKPKLIIKNVNKNQIKRIGDRVIDNLVFNLGLIELLSYWKATCSPEILIKAGYLNGEQIKWWKDLIDRGMGQFFFENKIKFCQPDFLKTSQKKEEDGPLPTFQERLKNRILVPVGGGKDSIVTLEILFSFAKTSKDAENIACFSLNPTREIKNIIKIAKLPSAKLKGGRKNVFQKSIFVERKIDGNLLKLNRQGFLNGHTPFSAYLAFLSVLCAVLFDFKYIAFSNERSSNEGNVKYLGRMINHQYSKSFDFEKKFRYYSKKYLVPHQKFGGEIEYFSFLRPLYEIQIAKLFSGYPRYFSAFLSCNEAYKTYSGTKKITNPEGIPSGSYGARKWCDKCPKCLFVFATLYPFLERYKLIKIFKEDLFKKISLLPTMLELTGLRKFKPFECVGTKKESLIALYLGWEKSGERFSARLPFLLKYFEKNILPKYPNLEKEAKIIMNSWSNQHNLPGKFEKILKKNLWYNYN